MKKLLKDLTDRELKTLARKIRLEHIKSKYCYKCKYNMLTCCQEFRERWMFKNILKDRMFLDDEWAMDEKYNIIGLNGQRYICHDIIGNKQIYKGKIYTFEELKSMALQWAKDENNKTFIRKSRNMSEIYLVRYIAKTWKMFVEMVD